MLRVSPQLRPLLITTVVVTTGTATTAIIIDITTTTIIIVTVIGFSLSTVAPATTATIETSPLFEVALVLVHFDHVASLIVDANDDFARHCLGFR